MNVGRQVCILNINRTSQLIKIINHRGCFFVYDLVKFFYCTYLRSNKQKSKIKLNIFLALRVCHTPKKD